MNFTSLIGYLEDIRDTSSRTEKEELLQDILVSENAEVFQSLCAFIFDKYRTINIKVKGSMLEAASDLALDPTQAEHKLFGKSKDDEAIWINFNLLVDALESREFTGKAAKELVIEFLSGMDYDTGEWFAMFLNKNWKIGVGRPTMDKLLGPDFAPRFDVQLCAHYDKWIKKNPQGFPFPYIAQPKLDGLRGVVGKFPRFEGKRVALTRNGKELYNIGSIIEVLEMMESEYTEEMVFDGEFFYMNFKTSQEITRRSTKGHPLQDKLVFYVFDAVPLREWLKGECSDDLDTRDHYLKSAELVVGSPRVQTLPHEFVSTSSECKASTSGNIAKGFEGSVFKNPLSKYAYERTNDWLKDKETIDVDATIVGIRPGLHNPDTNEIVDDDDPRWDTFVNTPGNKWVLSALLVDPGNGVISRVGTGFTIKERYSFYKMHEDEELIDKIVEVRFQEYTEKGKLRFPRYLWPREDK